MPPHRGPISVQSLSDAGLDWLFPASFLGQLSTEEQERVLAAVAEMSSDLAGLKN